MLVLPGKDARTSEHATFVNLRQAGMPALDVIRAVTINAAEVLGWQDRVGTIEPAKFADLVAVLAILWPTLASWNASGS